MHEKHSEHVHPETCARTEHIWHLDRTIGSFINIIQYGMAVESATQGLGFATVGDQIAISGAVQPFCEEKKRKKSTKSSEKALSCRKKHFFKTNFKY